MTCSFHLQLKSQQERIESLVDNVVQGYHSGFNKAIHNYSQILHLFSVSKDQVCHPLRLTTFRVPHHTTCSLCSDSYHPQSCKILSSQVKKLRSQLEDAQRRLVSRSQSLELQVFLLLVILYGWLWIQEYQAEVLRCLLPGLRSHPAYLCLVLLIMHISVDAKRSWVLPFAVEARRDAGRHSQAA